MKLSSSFIQSMKNVITATGKTSYYISGLELYREKNWEEALRFFLDAIEDKPKDARALFKAGMCYFRLKEYESAKAYMERALEVDPTQTQWLQQLNQTYRHLGYKSNLPVESEEELLIKEIEKKPNKAASYEKLAALMHKNKVWWREVDALKKAVSLDKGHATWYYRLAFAHENMHQYKEAALAYQQGIDLWGTKTPAKWFYKLGYVLEQGGGSVDDINRAYKRAINLDDKLESKKLGIGVFHLKNNKPYDALDAFEKKIKLTDKKIDASLLHEAGKIAYKLFQWEKSENYLRSAIQQDWQNAYWHYELGIVLERQKKYDEAAQAYKCFNILSPQNKNGVYREAFCFGKKEDFTNAVNLIINNLGEKITTDSETDLVLELKNKGVVYLEKILEQRIDSQLACLENDLKKDNTHLDQWERLGVLKFQNGSSEEGIEAIRQAINRSNQHIPRLYYILGYMLAAEDQYEKAYEALVNIKKIRNPYFISTDILGKDHGFAEAAIYTEYYEDLSVEDDIILYESFHGASISCNPLGIYKFLEENPDIFNNYRHFWVVNNKDNVPQSFKNKTNVYIIERGSDIYLRILCKAKILINNNTFAPYYIRKKNQIYLNTWHGTPWKYLGNDMQGRFYEHKNFTRNILQSTHLLSPNKHTTEIFVDKHDIKDIYSGSILELGYPRIDLTLNMSARGKEDLKEKLGISKNKNIILYAPTWRGVHGNVSFDYDKLYTDIELMSQDSHNVIIFRGHSLIEDKLHDMDFENVIVPPAVYDTNTVLSITDVLITDYSSILFDFLPTNKKIILYLYDYESYKAERGLYFAKESMPMFTCQSIEEVLSAINSRDEFDYSDWKNRFCYHEDGRAAEKIWKALFSPIKEGANNKESLLFYGGPFMGNGITTSYINTLSYTDNNKYTKSIVIEPGAISKEEDRLSQFAKVPENINVIARVGRMDMTLEDRYLHGVWNNTYTMPSLEAKEIFDISWQREYRRIFGYAHVDKIINFEGYSTFWAGLFQSVNLNAPSPTKFIYQHNDKMGEFKTKYPYLKAIFKYYNGYSKIVSVSKPTMTVNKQNIAPVFSVDPSKFVYCENIQDVKKIKIAANEKIEDRDEIYFSSKSSQVLLTIGRLSVEKGHAKLIKAFAKAKAGKTKLLIMGEGPLRVELQQLIFSLNLQDRVFLIGRRTNPYPYIKRSSCFILPSDHEGQPMVLLEALILNTPIIATDIPGSRSVLENRGGVIVPNSEEGLIGGLDLLDDDHIQSKEFDVDKYQKSALSMFDTMLKQKIK